MTQVARAYADGRGQDFADGRFAIDHLLREEPKHRPLAGRFRALMGSWLQDAHNKRQQEEYERRQKREREVEEREMKEANKRDKAEDKENKEEGIGEEAIRASEDSPSSTASADSQHVSKDGDEVEGSSMVAGRAKSVFDLSGLVDTDEGESSSDDDETSSDEESTAHK